MCPKGENILRSKSNRLPFLPFPTIIAAKYKINDAELPGINVFKAYFLTNILLFFVNINFLVSLLSLLGYSQKAEKNCLAVMFFSSLGALL